MSKKMKHRNFTFIIYPESVPKNWVTKLEELGIEMAISPLHDKDKKSKKEISNVISENMWEWSQEQIEEYKKNPGYKKAHHHVIYIAKNPVTSNAVRNRIRRTLGEKSLSMVQVVDNVENMYAYLTHESKSAIEEGKHIYDKADIIHLNGFDIENYITLSKGEKTKVSREIIDIIHDNRLSNYYQLEQFVRQHGEELGLKIAEVRMVAKEQSSFLRLIFDGVYQEFVRDRHINK